jgi:hypothetical protein
MRRAIPCEAGAAIGEKIATVASGPAQPVIERASVRADGRFLIVPVQ